MIIPCFEQYLEDGMFAAMAAIGFSSISHTPRRSYIICAITAAAGHSSRFLLMLPETFGLNIVIATTIAAFIIGVIGVFLAPLVKVPAETCLFPALLPMIPGIYAYKAINGLVAILSSTTEEIFNHNLYTACFNGLTCTIIIMGMVLGANLPIFMLKKISFRATR